MTLTCENNCAKSVRLDCRHVRKEHDKADVHVTNQKTVFRTMKILQVNYSTSYFIAA